MSKFADILGVWLNSFFIGDKTLGDKKLRFFGTYSSELIAPSTLTAARTWTLPNQSGVIALTTSTSRLYAELLTITAINVLSNLTYLPDNSYNLELIINGKSENIFSNSFSVSDNTITWNQAIAGYSIETTFEVIARYTTNQ